MTSLGSGSHLTGQFLAGKNSVKPSEVNWILAGAGATLQTHLVVNRAPALLKLIGMDILRLAVVLADEKNWGE
ncbi:MAG: hypothetical protein M3069_00200 [Chloroflexota bacterium]|nr:hypothetical protein [Chloroflexota bacterium]